LPWLPTKPWNCLPTVVDAFDKLMSDWKRYTPAGGLLT
jgi:hypothetical protein